MIVTGANSMIGSRFLELTTPPSQLLIGASELDLIAASTEQILKTLSGHVGETLVHFAAYTDVDEAETQRQDLNGACWQLNVTATEKLVVVAKKLNLKIIYISSDFVFAGGPSPYSEMDKVANSADEISWYGWTKLIGEKVIQDSGIHFLIARTSYPFRANFPGKSDFVRNIIDRLKNNNLYPMFTDQFLTPTFIDNFVKALDLLISQNQVGVWHVVDNITLSAYDAGVEIAKVFGFAKRKIRKANLAKFQKENPTLAKRPISGGLKNDKLRKFLRGFGEDMQDFREALEEMKQQISKQAYTPGV